MTRLALLGASGHGKVVADIAELLGWDEVVFFDDAWPGLNNNGPWPVVGDSQRLYDKLASYDGVLVSIGNNSIRANKLSKLINLHARIISLCHPTACISRYADFGLGSVVMASAVVNAGVSSGIGGIFNTGCTVDHDCIIGDYVHVSPGAHLAGGVKIGTRSWVGIGSCVRQEITLGCDVVVGAGAAVIKDIPDNVVVKGVPAKV